MDFLEKKRDEIVDGIFVFFAAQIETEPEKTLKKIEGELKHLYIRFDNAWSGRGVVGDTTQQATISGLEGVRAECLDRIKRQKIENRSS